MPAAHRADNGRVAKGDDPDEEEDVQEDQRAGEEEDAANCQRLRTPSALLRCGRRHPGGSSTVSLCPTICLANWKRLPGLLAAFGWLLSIRRQKFVGAWRTIPESHTWWGCNLAGEGAERPEGKGDGQRA